MEAGNVVNILQWLNSKILWGPPALIFLLGTHIFLTFRLRFIQRYIGTAIKLSISRDSEGQGDVSQFGALATALAATIGTGNIVGVATAIAGGGPGAVFWCWITGVFGIATKYSEAVLAVKYRVRTEDGSMAGGPMYVLERALKCRWAGVLFSIFAAIAAFGIGNTVQANAISGLAYEAMSIPRWVTGIVLMFLTAIVILGGVRSIAKVCGALVPFMAGFYVIGCLVILLISYSTIPETIKLIITHAFYWQGNGWRLSGARSYRGNEIRRFARVILQRVGARLCANSCCSGSDKEPCQAGTCFGKRNFLGHGSSLRDDRIGFGEYRSLERRP